MIKAIATPIFAATALLSLAVGATYVVGHAGHTALMIQTPKGDVYVADTGMSREDCQTAMLETRTYWNENEQLVSIKSGDTLFCQTANF